MMINEIPYVILFSILTSHQARTIPKEFLTRLLIKQLMSSGKNLA
jgi:hypothetical protein